MPKMDNLEDMFGEIIGKEWGMGGILNITASIYIATYETPEDATVAEYELKAIRRECVYPKEAAQKFGYAFYDHLTTPTLFINRSGEIDPPPELLTILEQAKSWTKASLAHPYIGIGGAKR